MLRLCCVGVLLSLVPQAGDEYKEYAAGTIRKIVGSKVILTVKGKDDTVKDVEFYVGNSLEPFDVDGKKLKNSALLWILQKGNVIDVKTKRVNGKAVGERGDVDFAVQVKAIKILKADELLQAGSEWVGTYKLTTISKGDRQPSISSNEFRFVVKSRDEEKFKGEMWAKTRFDNNGMQIEGTIDKKGVIRFAPTKEIGDRFFWPDNSVGFFNFTATAAGARIAGKGGLVTGNTHRLLEFDVTLKARD